MADHDDPPCFYFMAIQVYAIVIFGSNQEILSSCLDALATQDVITDLTIINNTSFTQARYITGKYEGKFNSIQWINNDIPYGFSANNNLAIRHFIIDAPLILLLNDDAILLDHALVSLVNSINSSPSTGAIGPEILNKDFSLQWAQVPFAAGYLGLLQAILGNRITGTFYKVSPSFPFWLIGACLLIRKEALLDIGGLDEGYGPGYGEDMDLLWRLRRGGWSIAYYDEASVIHLGGSSFGQHSYRRHRLIIHNLFRFMNKWLPKWQVILLKTGWLCGSTLRLILTLPRRKKKGKFDYLLALKAIIHEFCADPEKVPTTL
jgi:GT2 family glycosyltransferase